MERQGGHNGQLRRQGIRVREQRDDAKNDGPYEADVDEDIDLIAVVRTVKCELLLQVK